MNNCSGPCRYCFFQYAGGCAGENFVYRDDFFPIDQKIYDVILSQESVLNVKKEELRRNFPEFHRTFAHNEDVRDRFKLMEL